MTNNVEWLKMHPHTHTLVDILSSLAPRWDQLHANGPRKGQICQWVISRWVVEVVEVRSGNAVVMLSQVLQHVSSGIFNSARGYK